MTTFLMVSYTTVKLIMVPPDRTCTNADVSSVPLMRAILAFIKPSVNVIKGSPIKRPLSRDIFPHPRERLSFSPCKGQHSELLTWYSSYTIIFCSKLSIIFFCFNRYIKQIMCQKIAQLFTTLIGIPLSSERIFKACLILTPRDFLCSICLLKSILIV